MEAHVNPKTLLLLAALLASAPAVRAAVLRHPIPNSTFPISQAVQVTGNGTTFYVSGQVPPLLNKDADPQTPQAYGDVKAQTVGVLNRIKGILDSHGLGMGDVVK